MIDTASNHKSSLCFEEQTPVYIIYQHYKYKSIHRSIYIYKLYELLDSRKSLGSDANETQNRLKQTDLSKYIKKLCCKTQNLLKDHSNFTKKKKKKW